MKRYYNIEGTVNINGDPQYTNPEICSCPSFYEKLDFFKSNLIKEINENQNKTYMHWGDGDGLFLNKVSIGSTVPGRRALSISYDNLNLDPFYEGVPKNDYICIELIPDNRKSFKELFPNRNIDFNTEYIYALVCNKWFTNTFTGKIGLIGADPKLKIIEKLMHYKEYQNYLGLEKFNDYITIPQKFTCDDIKKTELIISEQLKKASSKIFLYGIGFVKSALSWRFKMHCHAVYIDIGAGIDCLAGMSDHTRPYAEAWINYRLKNYDYSGIDYYNYKPREDDILL